MWLIPDQFIREESTGGIVMDTAVDRNETLEEAAEGSVGSATDLIGLAIILGVVAGALAGAALYGVRALDMNIVSAVIWGTVVTVALVPAIATLVGLIVWFLFISFTAEIFGVPVTEVYPATLLLSIFLGVVVGVIGAFAIWVVGVVGAFVVKGLLSPFSRADRS